MVPTVALVTLPKACAALRIGASASSSASAAFLPAGTIASSSDRRSFMSISVSPFSSATRNATFSTPSCTSFRSSIRDSSSGPISVTVARTGWPCSPNTSQNTVENWSGWNVRPISRGPLDDKILGLTDFGDAGEVSLDVGREHRNAGARKSLGHHLQRDGLSGSGGAGDETVAIGKPERQPCRLFALADENLVAGIGHLVVGRSHCIASSRDQVQRVSVARRHNHTASCKPIETGQRLPRGIESAVCSVRDRPVFVRSIDESCSEAAGPATNLRKFRSSLLHCCNTRDAI